MSRAAVLGHSDDSVTKGYSHATIQRLRPVLERIDALPGTVRRRIELRGWVELDELRRIEAAAGCGVLPERHLVWRLVQDQNTRIVDES